MFGYDALNLHAERLHRGQRWEHHVAFVLAAPQIVDSVPAPTLTRMLQQLLDVVTSVSCASWPWLWS